MKRRRGISPILSVIILIGIAAIGGTLVYNVQNQVLTSGLNQIELSITDLRLEKDSKGACYFHSTLHNSGSQSITSIHLKTTLDSGDDFVRDINSFGSELIPGDSTNYPIFLPSSDNSCGNFTASNTYAIHVNASSIDSTFSIIKSMQVKNVTRQ